jgi:hypothetical protein
MLFTDEVEGIVPKVLIEHSIGVVDYIKSLSFVVIDSFYRLRVYLDKRCIALKTLLTILFRIVEDISAVSYVLLDSLGYILLFFVY